MPAHKPIKTIAEIDELRIELHPHPFYSSDLAPSNFNLFSNLNRWLQGKTFSWNEEVKWEIDGYFGGLDKSYYKKSIEINVSSWKDIMLKNIVYWATRGNKIYFATVKFDTRAKRESNNHTSKINFFFPCCTRFFFYEGVKKWICLTRIGQ